MSGSWRKNSVYSVLGVRDVAPLVSSENSGNQPNPMPQLADVSCEIVARLDFLGVRCVDDLKSLKWIDPNSSSQKDGDIGRRAEQLQRGLQIVGEVLAAAVVKPQPPQVGTPLKPSRLRAAADAVTATIGLQHTATQSLVTPTTKYRRGSLYSPSTTASFSVAEPDVVETDRLVVGRDEDDNKTINHYVILGELGRGSFGKVKLAEHQTTKQIVAIKIVKADLDGLRGKAYRLKQQQEPQHQAVPTSGSVRDKIMREIAVMKKVAHRNLVALYEVINDPSKQKIYLVMQYVPHGAIAIKTSPTTVAAIDPETLRGYAQQIVAGIRALHRVGVYHRDVKPDNILLGDNNSVFVADFGVSVICSEDGVEGVEGTPAFLAPEVCRGEMSVNGEAVDCWALGVTLYQLMYGYLPFQGETHLQLIRRIINDEPAFEPRPDVPSSFVAAIQGLLAKAPHERWTLRNLSRCDWLADPNASLNDSTKTPSSSTCSNGLIGELAFDCVGGLEVSDDELSNSIASAVVVETPFAAARGWAAVGKKLLESRVGSMFARAARAGVQKATAVIATSSTSTAKAAINGDSSHRDSTTSSNNTSNVNSGVEESMPAPSASIFPRLVNAVDGKMAVRHTADPGPVPLLTAQPPLPRYGVAQRPRLTNFM